MAQGSNQFTQQCLIIVGLRDGNECDIVIRDGVWQWPPRLGKDNVGSHCRAIKQELYRQVCHKITRRLENKKSNRIRRWNCGRIPVDAAQFEGSCLQNMTFSPPSLYVSYC